ncbi:MAG: HepT-like ribonuclease domain-containing protein [Allosphingosinicella sp.]
MSAPAQAASYEAEAEFLEGLRSRYEAEGFSFTVAPDRSVLPDFLTSYRPDAVARKPGQNVAIELKRHQAPSTERRVQDIRRLFEGHPDWQLHVAYMNAGSLQSVTIPTASPEIIRMQLNEVQNLSAQGHHRAAFVMAWSLLEAALQSVDDAEASRPRMPGTVVQSLSMNGFISPETEQRLRALIELRNRIVHGDVTAAPTPEHVDLVARAIEDTLAVDAA